MRHNEKKLKILAVAFVVFCASFVFVAGAVGSEKSSEHKQKTFKGLQGKVFDSEIKPVEGSSSGGSGINGQQLYFRWCGQCHGPDGKGDGVNSTDDMLINPSDHSNPAFMTTRSDKQLAEVIKEGGTRLAKSPLMPSWEQTLNHDEIDAIVKFLRRLCKCEFEGVISHEKLRKVDPDFR